MKRGARDTSPAKAQSTLAVRLTAADPQHKLLWLERNDFPADSTPGEGMAPRAMVVFAEIVGFPEWNKHMSVTSVSPFAHPLSVESASFLGRLILLTPGEVFWGHDHFTHNLFCISKASSALLRKRRVNNCSVNLHYRSKVQG